MLNSLKHYIVNGTYLVVVFAVAFLIATQSLARKINTFDATHSPMLFTVDKDDVEIYTTVAGRVGEIAVRTGEHVDEGDILAIMVDDSLKPRIQALEAVAEQNISARTELELLKAHSGEYEIKAPRSGVVYEIKISQGSVFHNGVHAITLLADDNVRLVSSVDRSQYGRVQNNKNVHIFNPRLEQSYAATFEGVAKIKQAEEVDEEGNKIEDATEKYQLQFKMVDESESVSLIEGETLQAISRYKDEGSELPIRRIAALWNSLIIGD